jgi:hypothetical protein
LILGENVGTQGMSLLLTLGEVFGTAGDLPENVLAEVYYPNLPKNRHHVFWVVGQNFNLAHALQIDTLRWSHA